MPRYLFVSLLATTVLAQSAFSESIPPKATPGPSGVMTPRSVPPEPLNAFGAVTLPATGALSEQLGLPPGFGLVVDGVLPGSPAALAGLKRFDVLKAAGEQKLVSAEQLTTLLGAARDGEKMTFTIFRKARESRITAKLGPRPPEVGRAEVPPAEPKRPAVEAAPVKPEPQTIVVPDQHRSVQAAMEAARAGDTIQLKPGRYLEAIVFKDGVKLVGLEPTQTHLEAPLGRGRKAVIWAENCRSGSIENLIIGGGGVLDGIVLKDSKVTVENCRVEGAGNGIVVTGPASVCTLRGNRVSESGRGIVFKDGAQGWAEDNLCEQNSLNGISVLQAGTSVELWKNRCRENKKHGIEFAHDARGSAEENLCEENKGAGLIVDQPGTVVTIRRNILRRNAIGLAFTNQATGWAEANTIEGSREIGVIVADGSTPELRQNQIRRNHRDGVQILRRGLGILEGNSIENNEGHGLLVSDPQTKPILRMNRVNNNRNWGLMVVNSAEPKSDSNRFSENGLGAQVKR